MIGSLRAAAPTLPFGALGHPHKEKEMKNSTQKQVKRYLWTLGCFATILLMSCSSGPSESQGQKFLEDYYGKTEYAKVKSFSKTNGIEKPNGYFLEFEADLECLRDVEPGYRTFADDFGFYCTKAGAVKKTNGSIRFEKTENGWRAVEGLPKTP